MFIWVQRGSLFSSLPLSENAEHRVAVYVEEHVLSHGLRAGDAITAATAPSTA